MTVECPYCEEYVELNADDHYEGYAEYECPECGKNFEVLAEPTVEYTAQGKADCLNGGEHIWEQKRGYPEIHFRGKYQCRDCSATKEVKEELATKEEWEQYFNNGCKG